MVAVAVTVADRISIDVNFGPCLCRPVGNIAGLRLSSGTTRTPAMPDVIALRTMMDEDKEAKGDREGTVEATEDHIQEVAL